VNSDPVGIVKECLALVSPRWVEMASILGYVLVPCAVVSGLSFLIPIAGGILSLVASIASALAVLLGMGAAAEYAMRLAAGTPIAPKQAWQVHRARLWPWLVGILVPALIASIGLFITVILFGLFLLPVYMIEQRKGFAVNSRSLEISSKDWMLALVPSLIVSIPYAIALTVLGIVFGLIPFVGPLLTGLVNAVGQSVLLPLSMLIQFRVYFAILQKHEQTDAAQIVRSRPLA
jgi:hypothetical protein